MDILQSLPNETLGRICMHLSLLDLANLSLVSPLLGAISLPFRVRNLFLSSSTGVAWTSPDTGDGEGSSVEECLRTLITPGREAIATYIHSLTLVWVHGNPSDFGPPPHQPLSDIALLTQNLSPLNLKAQKPSAQVMLLLLRLTRLRVLEIGGAQIVSSKLFKLEFPVEIFQTSFQFLREFYYRTHGTGCAVSCQTLLLLLGLPCIRSIDVELNDTTDIPPGPATAGTSTVTKLVLLGADVQPSILSCLLKIPQALTHFVFSTRSKYHSAEFPLWRALDPLRSTLQHLSLGCHQSPAGRDGVRDDQDPGLPYVGSLSQWTQLRILRCSLSLLLGTKIRQNMPRLADVIPPGIHKLEILPDYWSYPAGMVVMEVVHLLEWKMQVVPDLWSVATKVTNIDEFEIFRLACEARGVQMITDCGVLRRGYEY